MSRHGYSDDLEQKDLAMWRGRVASAIRGQRGQKLLLDLRDALDAMPKKRLIGHFLVDTSTGDVCALGCLGQARAVPGLENMDSSDHDGLAMTFDVAACLIQEIEYINDEWAFDSSPEIRWKRVRAWVEENIREVRVA